LRQHRPGQEYKKTAPVKEGDATRAVCKENSFCVLIGNIYKQVNYSQEILPPRQLTKHHIAVREK
jgi:hypothetical protein